MIPHNLPSQFSSIQSVFLPLCHYLVEGAVGNERERVLYAVTLATASESLASSLPHTRMLSLSYFPSSCLA